MDKIPFVDFGGAGTFLHFAHANAYPPACYRQFLESLTADFHVVGLCQRPLWPESRPDEMESWDIVAGDLIQFLEQQGYDQVIGVGHSLGAVATMLAAIKRPYLFRALALIEPVFLPPNALQLIAANPTVAENMPFVQVARRRRYEWQDRQAAFDHFRPKKVFRRWPDTVLWDYVAAGLRETADGQVVLAYSREWEARFYSRPPLTVWEDIPRITLPTLAVRGAESDTLFPEAWQLWQALQPDAAFIELQDVGHMVPMERPLRLADAVLKFASGTN